MTRLEAIRARVKMAGNDPLYVGRAVADRAHLLTLVDDLAGVARQVLAFDVSPTFDARGSYTERKARELATIQEAARAALARTEA